MRTSLENKTRFSWWFPRLPSDILVPETVIIPYDGDDLICLLEVGPQPGYSQRIPMDFRLLCAKIIEAGDTLGWPLFLRTDYLSGKHRWKDTCYVKSLYDVPQHIIQLVEESAMADIIGFPTDRWIARKLIPTRPVFKAFGGEMPIVKERRYFVQDAKMICHHPYWPPDAFGEVRVSFGNWRQLLYQMNYESDEEIHLLSELSSKVGAAIGGAWSIDWMWSEDECQWYLTDMAEAAQSYHWPGCSNETRF